MESYYLLRSNRESGPYSFRELRAKGLFSTDLLWIDGESDCWKHPAEMEGLASLVREPEKKPVSHKKAGRAIASASSPVSHHPEEVMALFAPAAHSIFYAETEAPSFEALKQKYAAQPPRKKVLKRPLAPGANLIGLVTFVLGISLAAFMIKKAVDTLSEDSHEVPTAEAHPIQSEVLPKSSTAHAAMSLLPLMQAPKTDTAASTKLPAARPAKPALTKKPARPEPMALAMQPEKSATDSEAGKPGQATKEETPPAADPKPEETAEKPATKPGLRLSANQYSVGLFGGISKLELTVTNPSSQPADKAVVQVDYLKSNGKMVGSKTIDVPALAPGASLKLSVPDNGRGSTVHFRVLN